MPQDAFTLRYLCAELDSVFKGGKVNRIIQPDSDELVLTVYTGKRTEKLFFNVNPASPRIGVSTAEKESPLTAPNFCMLMRKHLLSSTILGVELIGFDRIVKIDFMASGEFFDAVKKSVYVELMGRYSNVILTEDGKILGGNRGINMFDNGVRPLFVGQPYVFPPVGDKRLPSDRELIECFDGVLESELSELIIKNVQGIAKSTANEIVLGYYALNKTSESLDGERFFEYLNEYLFNTETNPCVLTDLDGVKDVCVYPYKTLEGNVLPFDKLYLAEEFYFSEKDKLKRFKSKKERLSSITNTAVKKVKKRLTAIKAKEKDALSAEENRIKGELLLANIYRIKNGEKQVTLDNYYDGSNVTIALDERVTVSKNAENYYKKYNKQKRTLIALEPQRKQAEDELNYFNSILDEIALAETIEELVLVQNELETAGLIVERNKTVKKKAVETFCREYSVFGFRVRAGRNNAENDKLTFTAKPNDIWVHAKDYHSSHLIIESNGKAVPEKVIMVAAEICAYYSKGREGGKTEISYTEKKNVKKPPKSKPGFVTYDNFNSIVAIPEKHTEFLKCD